MTDTSPSRASRLRHSPRDWLEAAVAALAEGGLSNVAIEPLARRLGVTKGSFYHHFANLDALILALLALWEQEGTDAVIESLDSVVDPRERLRGLVHVSWERIDHLRAEAALTAAASTGDPRVAPVVARVTSKRLAFVERTYRALGCKPTAARHRALHALSTYLGTVSLVGAGALNGDRELRAHMRYLEGVLVPDECTEDQGAGGPGTAANANRPATANPPAGVGTIKGRRT